MRDNKKRELLRLIILRKKTFFIGKLFILVYNHHYEFPQSVTFLSIYSNSLFFPLYELFNSGEFTKRAK